MFPRVLISALIGVVAGSCAEPLGMADATKIALAIEATIAGDGASAAYAKTDEIHVRVTASGAVAAETTLSFQPRAGSATAVQVEVDTDFAEARLAIEVGLLSDGALVFEGEGQATPVIGALTPVDITLVPVIALVDAPADVGPITAIGSTLQIDAEAAFATGDFVPGATLDWATLDPNVVDVSQTGLVTARAEGVGRVQASAGSALAIVRVTVQAEVVTVDLEPAEANVPVGFTVEFTAIPRDANGNGLSGRQATWESSNPDVLAVIAPGIGMGVAVGEADMIATVDGVEGTAAVSVEEVVPAAPSNLTSDADRTTVSLNWADNADNETHYEVLRADGPEGETPAGTTQAASHEVVVATIAPNTTAYTDNTGIVDELFEYTVRACNDAGCSPPSPSTIVTTVPDAPADAAFFIIQDRWVLFWSDLRYETSYEIDVSFDAVDWILGEFDTDQDVTGYDFGFSPNYIYYRVRACNDAGCSEPSPSACTFCELAGAHAINEGAAPKRSVGGAPALEARTEPSG